MKQGTTNINAGDDDIVTHDSPLGHEVALSVPKSAKARARDALLFGQRRRADARHAVTLTTKPVISNLNRLRC